MGELGTERIITVATTFFLLERRGLDEALLSLCPILGLEGEGGGG